MEKIEHKVTHSYQPTNTTCCQTALSILLSHYGEDISATQIEDIVPQILDENGEKSGTICQHLATWCISNGYSVIMHTFDCQVIDQSWSSLEPTKVIERMKLRRSGWVVPSLGEHWTSEYAHSYVDFIEAGGILNIEPAVTSKLINALLQNGPLYTCVTYSTLYATGRSRLNQNEDVKDDINGRAPNHAIVVYGINEEGNYLIADPDRKPGLLIVEPERLLAAISTAQIECDNLLFQITPKS